MRIGRSKAVGKLLRFLESLAQWASVTAFVTSKSDPGKFPKWLGSALGSEVSWVKDQAAWLIPFLLLILPLLTWLRKARGDEVQSDVHSLLEQIRNVVFKNVRVEHEQHNRVTLFRHRRFYLWRWPFFGEWLIPEQRSGTSKRKTSSIFRVCDDGEKCEGIAGWAWSKNAAVYVGGLPDMRNKNCSSAEIQTYAERTCIDPKVLAASKNRPQGCSFYGIPVEVSGRKWGVLVIDSVSSSFPKATADRIFRDLAPTLSKYASRM